MLLALDTATPTVSVALWDGRVLDAATADRPMKHGELLAPMIDQAMVRAGAHRTDLTAIAVGVGPGAFTGLRVGLVTARTLGLVLGIPVRGVCSLDVLAAAAVASGEVDQPFLATIDARRKELFWAAYDAQGRRTDGPSVDRPADMPHDLPVVGAAGELYAGEFERVAGPSAPDAATLAMVVAQERVELLDPEPLYLRRPDAVAPGPPKKVS